MYVLNILTRAPLVVEKNVKKRPKARKKFIKKLFRSNFRSGQICGLEGPKTSKISSFSGLSNFASEILHYLGKY